MNLREIRTILLNSARGGHFASLRLTHLASSRAGYPLPTKVVGRG